jgi:hypothetical protein
LVLFPGLWIAVYAALLAALVAPATEISAVEAKSGAAAPIAVAEQQRDAKMIAVLRRAAGDVFWLVMDAPLVRKLSSGASLFRRVTLQRDAAKCAAMFQL